MAFGLPSDQRSQTMFVLVVLALAGGYFFWSYVHAPVRTRMAEAREQIRTTDSIVRQAKAELAAGTVEGLRRKVDQYRAMVALLRRLVPERNEVAALIDDISNRAKVRGITIGTMTPLAIEVGTPFDTHRYRLDVYGRYDQIGEFFTDIASLPRIVVPYQVTLKSASSTTQRFVGDTLGSLLEVSFMIRTFVKTPAPATGQAGG
ncbi:MAG: type 4a pilus biogenesis protein PilO [Gemmatimonadales bacterium]